MCGIFGFTKPRGELTEDQIRVLRKSFTRIAEESSIRGQDSTGVALVGSSGVKIYKTLMSSDRAIHTKDWLDILNLIDADTTTVIGHTRYATTGTISIRNAHPFKCGQIVGAHNGVIYNWDRIKGHESNMEVDSEVIFRRLSKKKYKKALEGLDGYFALSWVDENPYNLYLSRSKDGPIQAAYWKKPKILFWASTESILEYGLIRAGLNIKSWGLKHNKIYQYHTQTFDKKPKFTTQKLDLSEFGGKYKPFGFLSAYDDYSFEPESYPCIGCGKTTSSKNGACGDCDAKYISECDMCQSEELLKDLFVNDDGTYLCRKCHIEINYMHECSYCGDYFYENELVGTTFKTCFPCNDELRIGEFRHGTV